jgi:hypothetical protein
LIRFLGYYAAGHYAECHYALGHYDECRYAECYYAECLYSECHKAECRGAINNVFNITLDFLPFPEYKTVVVDGGDCVLRIHLKSEKKMFVQF